VPEGSSGALGDHHRILVLGPRLVLVVVRPLLRRELPEPLALLARRRAGAGREDVVLDLELDLRVLREIPVPAGMLGRAALRRDDDVLAVVLFVDQRRRPRLTRLAALRRQEERLRPALPDVADLSVRLAVPTDVLLAVQVLGFAHVACSFHSKVVVSSWVRPVAAARYPLSMMSITCVACSAITGVGRPSLTRSTSCDVLEDVRLGGYLAM